MVPDYDSDNEISEVEATNINVDGPSDWNRVEVQDCAPEAPQTLETRSSTSSSIAEPDARHHLSKWHRYSNRVRGYFVGINKRMIEEAECPPSLHFFILFITADILQAFVIATNVYASIYHPNSWSHPCRSNESFYQQHSFIKSY